MPPLPSFTPSAEGGDGDADGSARAPAPAPSGGMFSLLNDPNIRARLRKPAEQEAPRHKPTASSGEVLAASLAARRERLEGGGAAGKSGGSGGAASGKLAPAASPATSGLFRPESMHGFRLGPAATAAAQAKKAKGPGTPTSDGWGSDSDDESD
jgi:hypothetical protein